MDHHEARLAIIDTAIDMQRRLLVNHPVFHAIRSVAELRTFMEWHAFAVWDFMSLVKRLQAGLTCVSIPWVPASSANAARLINEIVLSEECDHTPLGFMSHFELYLQAMHDIGASTKCIDDFLSLIRSGTETSSAMSRVDAPAAVQNFVNATLDTCHEQSTHEVLGAFLFGREDVIPDMFRSLLKRWKFDQKQVPLFHYYLTRHIEIDAEEHGPAARTLISEITRGDPLKREAALKAGFVAITARIKLWDALFAHLRGHPAPQVC
ncbi:DUF3050 domain-containing protein (plasmid) [Burkholderia pyrrocinia]|uniref:DUF3050 domain-containing protein n=1 Tax=Burkholderia pyrrocinia TaxID=60550 RepID=UPI0038B639B5